jgi:hypothetical protein
LQYPLFFQTLDKELVDGNVIPGHVVPDFLLFSRPLSKIEQKTATYTDKSSSIKVTAVIQLTDDVGKMQQTFLVIFRNVFESLIIVKRMVLEKLKMTFIRIK